MKAKVEEMEQGQISIVVADKQKNAQAELKERAHSVGQK